LQANTTYEWFTSAEDLASKVATSLHSWLLDQAVEEARATYRAEKAQRLPSSFPTTTAGAEAPHELDPLYWQEQVHLFSAQRASGGADGVQIALIAGRADTEHPALSEAHVTRYDARLHARESPPDDYTTALAALLVGNSSAGPYRGIAPLAHLLVVHVLDDQYVSSKADMLAGLDVAIRGGAQVVCLPLSGIEGSEEERLSYQHAADLGVVIVCPAGNESSEEPNYPGAFPDCLSVGAVDSQNRLADFSSFGEWVTTTAPGVNLPVAVGHDRYDRWSGTFYSCGILAGVVALMFKGNLKLTPDKVKDVLRKVGPPALATDSTRTSGHLKVLDACEAVRSVRD
jgi:subtilisin family serine protease